MEISEIMARFSLDVTGKCVLGLQFNTLVESEPLCWEVLGTMMRGSRLQNSIKMILAGSNLLQLFGMKLYSDEMENFVFHLLHDIERERQRESEHREDYLQYMLDMKENNANESAEGKFVSYFKVGFVNVTYPVFIPDICRHHFHRESHRLKYFYVDN